MGKHFFVIIEAGEKCQKVRVFFWEYYVNEAQQWLLSPAGNILTFDMRLRACGGESSLC